MPQAGATSQDVTKRLASRLADAEFVSLCCRADGDAVAATGLLGRTLVAIDTPFQATIRRPDSVKTRATDADLVVRVGLAGSVAGDHDASRGSDRPPATAESNSTEETETVVLPATPRPASLAAVDVARELGADPDPSLALAGSVAAAVRDARDPFGNDSFGEELGSLRERGHERGFVGERRPGIATPTTDVVDGLAHTTLAHTTFSGDAEATREHCGSLAEREDGRAVASLLALSVASAENAVPRAAIAIERALRPVEFVGSSIPFATLGGYADVLAGVAAERPGIALALALGYDVREGALSAWRAHARRAHVALREATIARYDGLCVARLTGADDADEKGEAESNGNDEKDGDGADPHDDAARAPIATIARLLRDFRSPEPIALVVGDGVGAVAATENCALGAVVARAARGLDGTGGGTERTADARFDDADGFVAAVRAGLADGTRGGDREGTPDHGGDRP